MRFLTHFKYLFLSILCLFSFVGLAQNGSSVRFNHYADGRTVMAGYTPSWSYSEYSAYGDTFDFKVENQLIYFKAAGGYRWSDPFFFSRFKAAGVDYLRVASNWQGTSVEMENVIINYGQWRFYKSPAYVTGTMYFTPGRFGQVQMYIVSY